VKRAAGVVLAVAVAVGVGAGIWLHGLRSGPGLPLGTVEAAGLTAPVEVMWDSVGVPQLYAGSVDDLLYAQGWVHAHHRLWQMEMFRRVARGRLSELFGEETLATDRFLRTLGLHRAARSTAAALDPRTRRGVEAYVAGVNARIASLPRLPPEFVLLGVEPEPFRVEDVTALEKILAWDLSAYASTLDHARAYAEVGPEGWARIRPRYPRWAPTIEMDPLPDSLAEPGPTASGRGSGAPPPPAIDPGLLAAAALPDGAQAWLAAASVSRASNAWVVGPERSASGRPLLANDPHLALDHPNLWYLVGLHAPGVDAVGASIAGMPGILLGHTPGVAWGFTNAYLDDMDLFVERVDPTDSTRYLTPDGSAPFVVHDEEIRVRGRAEPERTRVRETRHGPVMTPVEPRAGGELLALRWVAHDVSHAQRALQELLRVGTAADLLRVLRDQDVAHQNVVYADTSGAWGYRMSGRIPRRPGGRARILPVPGWTGEGDWQGYLAPEEHPRQEAPERGFIVTANHRHSWKPVSWAVSDDHWWSPFRALRITEVLSAGTGLTVDDMAALQADVVSAYARRYLPRAVAGFRAAGLDSAAAALAGWDGSHDIADTRAPLFHAWLGALRGPVRRLDLGRDEGFHPRAALDRRLETGSIPDTVAAAAARAALDAVRGRTWGELHTLTLEHPLATVPVLRALFGFGRRGLPRRGGPATVDVAKMTSPLPPWEVRAGASHRHVVDLADPGGTGRFVIPGGQSGWPGDPLTMNLLDDWRDGRTVHVPLARGAVEARRVGTLTLRPPG
jgi:penicillin amidase